jgi:hypothetical protein
LLHQVGDLFELNVKLRCQKVKALTITVCNKKAAYKTNEKPEIYDLQRATDSATVETTRNFMHGVFCNQ